jgi:branched-chain amino acid transport system ATP-binding protein
MAEGTVLAQGSAEEVKNNESVIEAYLGRAFNENQDKIKSKETQS